jgi:hypothetical protein
VTSHKKGVKGDCHKIIIDSSRCMSEIGSDATCLHVVVPRLKIVVYVLELYNQTKVVAFTEKHNVQCT